MLTFKESSHQYFADQKEYTSVSNVISNYKNKFDADFWSTYKGLEKIIGVKEFRVLKRYRDWKSPAFIEWCCQFVDMDDLTRETKWYTDKWDGERQAALDKGNHYHAVKEKQAYDKGYEVNPFTKKNITTMTKRPSSTGDKKSIDISNLEDGYYPELMIWNKEYRIAGTADKVFIETIRGNKYIDVDDFKTSKEIKRNNPYDKMKYPLNMLDDCNYNHYKIQISTYAWIMSQVGFNIRNISFTHFNQQYTLAYSKEHIINMLKHYEHNNRNDRNLSV